MKLKLVMMNLELFVCAKRIAAAALVAVLVNAGGATCSSGSQDLCGELAQAQDCTEDAPQSCRNAIAAQNQKTPDCSSMLDALTTCLAGLTLSCTPDGIAVNAPTANDDGDKSGGGPDNFSSVGDDDVVVNGGCGIEKRGYDACTTCTDAPGAKQTGVLGIGDACSSGGCADGLECMDGQCTRSCSSDDDCHARAKGCRLRAQFGNVCVPVHGTNRCTVSCAFGDDASCQFMYGSNYKCDNQACVPG
jgi:hypothetical protein